MMSYGLSLLLAMMAAAALLFQIATASSHGGGCDGRCGGGVPLPYPFGFSPSCPIQFTCSPAGEAQIGDFPVQNVTASSIFVGVPRKCNRTMEGMKVMFDDKYAPTSNNSFLMEGCRGSSNDSCSIQQNFLERQLNFSSCDRRGNISCFTLDPNTTKYFSFPGLEQRPCRSLVSSIAFEPVGQNAGIALEFERVRLGWWLIGDCNNGTCGGEDVICTNVTTADGKIGHRCSCPEGFTGDGFIYGSPCRRAVPYCRGSKVTSGRCRVTKFGILIGGIIAGASSLAGLALLLYCIWRRFASSRSLSSAKRLLCEAAGNSSIPFFPYKEIEKATSGFSEKQRLGTGAYGTVYAGKLNNDEWVAIKRLRHRDSDSIDQVMNEIKLLSSVSHPNLVRLLGCCLEEGEPVLVYEFMPNGTLSQHLQRERGTGLPWTVRLTIATQTAKAIAYLHSSMNPPIYHRDIKSSNILLDYDFNSKVADFGLSRLGGMTESSHISTAPQGTPGYLDPQYHQCFHLSDKSDVYSFGVVLVEIITALKVVDFNRPHSEINLAALAIGKIGSGCVDEIIDPTLELNLDAWTLSSIHNVAELAFRCLAFHRDMRPTMMEVAEELEQIRLSAWIPNMGMASPTLSQRSSEHGSEISMRKSSKGSRRRVVVPQKPPDSCLNSLEEFNSCSPVSVQDQWLSEQSSPSANSLLGNVPR